jgi:Family of unknown function (DUF5681)
MSKPTDPDKEGGLPRRRRPPGQPELHTRSERPSAIGTAVHGASAKRAPSGPTAVRRRPHPAAVRDTADDPAESYEVGYGKPPKKNQFKKGETPNPYGRGAKNKAADAGSVKRSLRAELAQFIKITEGTKAKKVTQGDVVVKTLIRKAMKGDNPAIRMLFAMLEGEDEPRVSSASALPGAVPLTLADTDILEQFRLQCIEQHLKSKGHAK